MKSVFDARVREELVRRSLERNKEEKKKKGGT